MQLALKLIVFAGFIRIYNCLKCFQCTKENECTEATECVDPIFNMLQPACGTESTSSGVTRYCVAQGESKDYGCITIDGGTTCVCPTDGCNRPGALAFGLQMTLNRAVTRIPGGPSEATRFRPATASMPTIPREPNYPASMPTKRIQCFDCTGCETPENLQQCPIATRQCVSIISADSTGNLIRRSCGSVGEPIGCKKEKNNIGTMTETCHCEKDSCNSSATVKPSIIASLIITTASTLLFH